MKSQQQNAFSLIDAHLIAKSLKIALLVGTILMLINHGEALFNNQMDIQRGIKAALSYCVPFCVSLYSAVSSAREYQ
ncbi:nitrate/nitrite transporter NrtS [Vibrio maerlii]|uniref:nitrate/nitrite transporter NrtS n=1 Tax=Vibrio maerlii TaxID=2231648 RepID=UPI000E3E0FB6|nr:nitrate/nitrite transporter NrtS [Vibrio maerlii]